MARTTFRGQNTIVLWNDRLAKVPSHQGSAAVGFGSEDGSLLERYIHVHVQSSMELEPEYMYMYVSLLEGVSSFQRVYTWKIMCIAH
jgi:hypothetical protein